MDLEEAVRKFLERCEPFLQDWDGLDVRVIAQQERGKSILRQARISGIKHGISPPPPHLPNLSGWVFDYFELPISRLDSLLQGIQEGRLAVSKRDYVLDVSEPPKTGTFFVRSPVYGGDGAYISLVIELDGRSNNRPPDLEYMLPVANPPFADPKDLFRSFFASDQETEHWGTKITFVMAPPVSILDIGTEGGSCYAELAGMDPLRAAKVKASVVARDYRGGTKRWQAQLDNVKETENGKVRWEYDLPTDITHGQFWLHDHGLILANREFIVPGRGREGSAENVLAVLSKDKDFLTNGLESIRTDATKLENWVHLVMHCLGWRSLLAGRMGKWETADVVAQHPRDRLVALVECTTSTPSHKNKLAKLHDRARDLSRAGQLSVIPVLATTRASENLSPEEKEAARKNGISLLGMEDLERLAQMVYEPEGQDLVEYLRNQIPPELPDAGISAGMRGHFI